MTPLRDTPAAGASRRRLRRHVGAVGDRLLRGGEYPPDESQLHRPGDHPGAAGRSHILRGRRAVESTPSPNFTPTRPSRSQTKLRKNEETEVKYHALLEASREALRKEKTAAAAEVRAILNHRRLFWSSTRRNRHGLPSTASAPADYSTTRPLDYLTTHLDYSTTRLLDY